MAARSNPNIKKANTVTEYTAQEAIELYKCGQDPVYFCQKYVKVQHPKRGTVPLELYDYQKKMIRAYQHNRFNIALSARQTGKCHLDSTKISVAQRVPLNFSLINILKRTLLRILDYEKYKQIYKNMPRV